MNAETDAVSDEKENRSAYGRMDRRLAVSREQVDWGAGWLAGWADGVAFMGGWADGSAERWVGERDGQRHKWGVDNEQTNTHLYTNAVRIQFL